MTWLQVPVEFSNFQDKIHEGRHHQSTSVKRLLLILSTAFACCGVAFTTSHAANDVLFFVFLNTNPDRPQLSEDSAKNLQAGHIANIVRLHGLGKLLVAGPFHGGGGMFIMNMGSAAEVWDSLHTDPAVRANRFRLEVLPMSIVHGGVCPAKEPVEMVTYAFLRHQWAPANSSSFDGVDSLLTVINFAGGQGGVVILGISEEERAREILHGVLAERHETSYALRRLWVGKGSFCEE